jgi:hypothetical protein
MSEVDTEQTTEIGRVTLSIRWGAPEATWPLFAVSEVFSDLQDLLALAELLSVGPNETLQRARVHAGTWHSIRRMSLRSPLETLLELGSIAGSTAFLGALYYTVKRFWNIDLELRRDAAALEAETAGLEADRAEQELRRLQADEEIRRVLQRLESHKVSAISGPRSSRRIPSRVSLWFEEEGD